MPGPQIRDSGIADLFRWEILIPTQRYIFTVDSGRLEEYNREGELSFHRFSRYQGLKADHPVHGMIAWPNTVLLSGPATVVVDPGLVMQGEPLPAALAERGLSVGDVDLVVNTHAHMDHVQANVHFPDTPIAIHEAEFGGSPARVRSGLGEHARLLSGDEGKIAPGLRFIRTPGHSEGSICVVAETGSGRLVIAGDTVGPLPSYFTSMELPAGFPAADRLLQSWRRIRELDPVVIIPGHNPPMRISV
ncbi:MAG TPA: MBL fold metallo-hydrolase [Thermoleophilia bacterium]|nr:MBL fold metallo-hydrolase [Thermoleophilia bacterium]